MPSTDDLLYNELGVDRQASAKSIKHAYRRLALRHHPDKDPQGTEKFKNISEAFQVLSDPDRRKKYDAQGYQAVLHRDPANRNNTGNDAEGVAQAAKDEFDDFLRGLDDDVDQEIDDLLDWWSNSGLDTSKVKTCLRIESDDFFDQLVALYDQYRLTHYATTNDERSKQVTPIMENFVEDHFGAANRRRLQGWNTHSTLEPVTNGKYIAKNGDFVDAPTRAPSRQLPPELDAVHIQKTSIFAEFLQFESKEESSKALKSLKSRHAKEYRKQWKALEKREKHKSHKEKMAWDSFKRDIDWAKIADDLVELYGVCKAAKGTGDVTGPKVSELKWQGHVKDYGFPEAWNGLVAKHITAAADVSYKQSTYEPSRNGDSSTSNVLQATVEDEDEDRGDLGQENARSGTSARQSDANALDGEGDTTMADKSSDDRSGGGVSGGTSADGSRTAEPSGNNNAQDSASRDLGELPDASITVEDGDERRSVFGWRSRGLGKQLYLVMTPADAGTAVLDIVNARLWQKSIQELTRPEHDLGQLKVDKSFLKGRDYSELKWKAIAVQRRYEQPAGGFANLPETQVIFRVKGEAAGGVKMAARSDMGAVYGKKQVDHDIRNLNAIMYEEVRDGGGGELDAEDTDEDGKPDGDNDVMRDGSDDTKFLTNAEARGEDPSLEEINALLQKMMRGKGKNRQRFGQGKTRSKQKPQVPDSPVPANHLEAQVLEMQILDAQRKLDRYKQSQSAP
ncbi:hypothetical protein Q7P35_008891 [Cladosporium inversicolor]